MKSRRRVRALTRALGDTATSLKPSRGCPFPGVGANGGPRRKTAMNIHSSDGEERLAEPEIESRTATASLASAGLHPHETPTLVPPPSDEPPESEPPPTARWTPPPALIASVRPRRLQ